MTPDPTPEVVAYRVGTLEGKVDSLTEHTQRLGNATRDLSQNVASIVNQLDVWKDDRKREEEDRVKRQDRVKANITWVVITATTVTSLIQTVVAHTVFSH